MVKMSGEILATKTSQMVQNHLLTTLEGFLSLQEYMLVMPHRLPVSETVFY